MRPSARHPGTLRLGLVFLVLVLLPSFFLGYFSLRAVENEKRTRRQRLLEDYERYAEFAGRAVRSELVELESAWQELLPARPGWEARREAQAAALDSSVLAPRFIERAWLLHTSGRVLFPPSGDDAFHAAPSAAEARLYDELAARGEAAEFDGDDPAEARAAYEEILRRVRNPRLRAMALASLGRLHMRAGDWGAARQAYESLVREAPEARDFDNQPLRFVAALQIARARAAAGDTSAATVLVELMADLVAHSDELADTQYDLFLESIDTQLGQLQPPAALRQRHAWLREQTKRTVGPGYFARKLERKLLRAAVDAQPPSLRMRYISGVADARPYLLAYVLLPDASQTRVNGLVGFQIDLERLSTALLPRFLRELELSDALVLSVLDEGGHRVIGEAAAAPPVVQSNLGEPFEFWNVAVYARAPLETATDFRTTVFLYVILLLLLTIVAGAVAVTLGLRREARLAALKTTFVSNVSHELRTPLTSIRMYAEMLEAGAARMPEDERRNQLAIIRSECSRLERLIDAVLDFASVSRGTKAFQLEYEEVGPLVQSVAEAFREQAVAQGFAYEVSVAPDLPEVRLDADAVRQMLLNLLSNAVKYSEDDRWIAVRAFQRGPEVALQVQDRGIGIEASEHEKIFQDFYRIDQRLSSDRQGLGLGLTLVRRIAAAHGGRVTVESAPRRGSTFTVWLPAEPAPAPPPEPPLPAGRTHA